MNRRLLTYLLLTVAILIAVAGFWADMKNTSKYGGVDLRNRVTATRVTNELHKDPYTYKWSPNDSDRYLDPADNVTIPYARVTVPPTVLLFHNLISQLPYRAERWVWFVFQWAALIASLALLGQAFKNNRALIWTFGLLFIAGSQFFRLHVERGQIYIWYVLLFSVAFYLYKRAEEKSSGPMNIGLPPLGKEESGRSLLVISALILGYLISLRPPFIFALIPFLMAKKFKFVGLAATGVLASVLLTGVFFPFALWKSYYASTSFQGAMRALPDIHYQSPGVDIAEGMNIVNFLHVPGEDSSLQRIVHAITDVWLGGGTLTVLLVIAVIMLALIVYKRRDKTADDTNALFLAAITFVMLSELFIPAPRWPYADVIWLIPIALLTEILRPSATSYSPFPKGGRGIFRKGGINARSAVVGLALTGLILNTGLHGVAKLTLLGEYLFIGALLLAVGFLPDAEPEATRPSATRA